MLTGGFQLIQIRFTSQPVVNLSVGGSNLLFPCQSDIDINIPFFKKNCKRKRTWSICL